MDGAPRYTNVATQNAKNTYILERAFRRPLHNSMRSIPNVTLGSGGWERGARLACALPCCDGGDGVMYTKAEDGIQNGFFPSDNGTTIFST